MRVIHKVLINLIVIALFFVLFYVFQTNEVREHSLIPNAWTTTDENGRQDSSQITPVTSNDSYNHSLSVWCIFTKARNNPHMKNKFKLFLSSMLNHTKAAVTINIITDVSSKRIALNLVQSISESWNIHPKVQFHDVQLLARDLSDIITTMQGYFSSRPGTYYSDALFFLSLGLHKIAPHIEKAALFDIDLKFMADISELFEEFDKFGKSALFGLGYELTPVYRHILYIYRNSHKSTNFGEPPSYGGFPGVNSGVMLLNLGKIRNSALYRELLQPSSVKQLVEKYSFKGHLGDQDFYTLMAMEHPELIHILPCSWNRQLCTWWKDHGYHQIFDEFFKCNETIKLYHGNCNTHIPDN